MKKVLLVVAQKNYQPLEYSIPKAILEEAGVKVFTASNQMGEAHSVGNYNSAKVDISLKEVDITNFDGLFFIGGPGALEYLDNEISYKLLQAWQATGKPYGAICISPRILAKAGVLQNKQATGWNGDNLLEKIFSQFGVGYIGEAVVRDGNVVTADGPSSAEMFGKKILEVLGK